jgi:class 3 adenylate cyclase
MNATGHWAWVLDADWRYVFMTDELRLSWGDTGAESAVPLGFHLFSAEATRFRASVFGGPFSEREFRHAQFFEMGGYVLSSMSGGRERLRQAVDPELADLVDELHPQEVPLVWVAPTAMAFGGVEVGSSRVLIRIDDPDGHLVGFCSLLKPVAGMSQLATAAATADLAHLERMRVVEDPDRRPAAILMADLEASSPLARRLSTPHYFALNRRLVRAADKCVVDAGGIVGRHAGDGVVAFFLAETEGSESAAARACITTARMLHDKLADIAVRAELSESEVVLRFGLHWGATVYIGRILTAGRSEVTALGDEVNEAARIEACATGGRTLASKSLIERLDIADADALGLDPRHTTYTPLAALTTATDKARRDAPSIAVCELLRPAP